MPSPRPVHVKAEQAVASWRRGIGLLRALACGAAARRSAGQRRQPPGRSPDGPRPPLPEGFGFVLDRAARRTDGGPTLVGGTPVTVLRLSPRGSAVVDGLLAGAPVAASGAANGLARRLVDRGLAHPQPPAGGPGPAVTVVIPVRDDPTGLAATLASLGPVEHVLVVDDGSRDPAAVRRVAATAAGPDAPRGSPAARSRLHRTGPAPNATADDPPSSPPADGRPAVGRPARGSGAPPPPPPPPGHLAESGEAHLTAPRRGGTQVLRLATSRGPGGARQVGWEASGTDFVAFVDAGCEPEPGWLGLLTGHLADPAVAAVAPRIRARSAPGTPRWLAAYERSRSPLDLGPWPAAVRPRSPVPYVPTAALVVRRRALEAAGGFDPALRFGEDVDLVWRLAGAGWVVRYEPAVTVAHPARPNLGTLLRQRYDYGCSAAPLAARHGAAMAPLAVSPWSALAWAVAAGGSPLLGTALAGAGAAALVPRLRSLHHPWLEASRLAGGGHLATGRLVANACRRTWWPVVALACLASRRARRAAVVLTVLPPLLERRPPRHVSLPAWLALRLAEDVAYGLGVWTGALRARSAVALRPVSTSGRGGHRPG